SMTELHSGRATRARYVLGLDLGTSNLRLHRGTYDEQGRSRGEPGLLRLPGSGPDCALPTVLELDARRGLRSYGRPAVQDLMLGFVRKVIADLLTCLVQAEQ